MKVGATFSFTLNLGNYQSTKLEMTLSEIDTEQPLEPQLERATPYIDGTFKALEDAVYTKLRESGLIKAVVK